MKRLIMATMVTAILASSTVWAADNAPVAAQQQTQQVQQTQKTAAAAERISEQGLYAMRDVQVARLALFHGDPEKAKELTNEASALLSDDSTEWAKFAKPGKKTNLNDDQYIVINASVGISESYVATPEKEAAIKIANEKMAKGDKKGAMEELRLAGVGAMEELRLAGVGVMENQYLMPLKQTRNALADAQKLLDKKQYYEANLALKGAEDGIIVDSEALFVN
ncbi:TPA: YfdX family protein [Escherichia coli]|nr:YfdX family protein [Escherichia coli]HBC1657582.1 YfdX family protein [Escherichia coli]